MSEERSLTATDIGAVVVGGIIGVGIFFTPGDVAAIVPSPYWVLGMWALGGVLAILGALVLADLGARMPKAGGFYVFLREGFGPKWGPLVAFLYGWVNLLIIQSAALAIIALVLVQNLEVLIGKQPMWIETAIAVGAIVTFAGANAVGLRLGSGLQRAITAGKLLAVACLVGLGVGWGSAAAGLTAINTAAPTTIPEILAAAMIPVLFSYGGWQHGTYVAGVARDPQRSIPKGIIGGVLIVIACYITINFAYLTLLGQDGMAGANALAAEAATVAVGPVGGALIAGAIVLSAAGILNTISLAFPYVIYAMAKDGLFLKAAGDLHPRTGTPVLAIVALSTWGSVGVLVGMDGIGSLLAGTSFAEWTFFALVAIAHVRLQRRFKETEGFRVGVWAPAIFGVASLAVALGALYVKPWESAFGIAAIVLGIFVYQFGPSVPTISDRP